MRQRVQEVVAYRDVATCAMPEVADEEHATLGSGHTSEALAPSIQQPGERADIVVRTLHLVEARDVLRLALQVFTDERRLRVVVLRPRVHRLEARQLMGRRYREELA